MADQLLPYQIEGAKFLASRQRAMLADEQGLGKSAQAIRASDLVMAESVTVVCPASVVENWKREFARWGRFPRDVNVFSYEGAVKAIQNDEARLIDQADAVIVDEAHYLKSPTTHRTQFIYPRAVKRPRLWCLSGTPIPNHAGELYTHFRYLAPDEITHDGRMLTADQFLGRYCVLRETPYGPRPVGTKNADDLRARLQGWFLRRTKADVNLQLPPIRYGTITLRPTTEDLTAIGKASKAEIAGYVDAGSLPKQDEHMSRARKMIAEAKVRALGQILIDELCSDQAYKVVVFGWHTEALRALAEYVRAANPVVVTGDVPAAERLALVDRFQTDRNCRVFIGNILAAGTGLTLTAASNLVFLECSWVPGENAQAAMRVHRIGQNAASVLIRFCQLAGTIDEAVTAVLANKTRQIAQLIE